MFKPITTHTPLIKKKAPRQIVAWLPIQIWKIMLVGLFLLTYFRYSKYMTRALLKQIAKIVNILLSEYALNKTFENNFITVREELEVTLAVELSLFSVFEVVSYSAYLDYLSAKCFVSGTWVVSLCRKLLFRDAALNVITVYTRLLAASTDKPQQNV